MAEPSLTRLSFDEYMAWESRQETRNEFVDGVVVAMVGGTQAHDRVKSNVQFHLTTQARGGRCRVCTSDMKVICGNGNVRYPDVSVDCAPLNPTSVILGEPRVVVEVLSNSTKATDFLLNLRDYATVASIEVYVIFWQDEPKALVHRRAEGATWHLAEEVSGEDGVIDLPLIGARLALADCYEGLLAS